MEKKKIRVSELLNVMSESQMKNVRGGSNHPWVVCWCPDDILIEGWCAFDTCDECRNHVCSGTCKFLACI